MRSFARLMIQPQAVLIGLILGIALSSAPYRPQSADLQTSTADEASLHALYQKLLDGWNQNSGAAFAAAFDERADLVAPGGFHLKGRERIASFHQMLFDGVLKDTQLVGVVRSVRFLTADVAIVHAIGGPMRTGDPAEMPKRNSVHTLVAVRRDGKWLLDAFQNTSI
jgi:uncharacterized protein (TIGR02246 family)